MNTNIRILLMDDVHLEGRPPEMCTNFSQKVNDRIANLRKSNLTPIVICAGDIGEGLAGIEWAKSFDCEVIYICGNHEFWSQDYFEEIENIRKKVQQPGYTHIHFLYNETQIIHGIRFVGTTLWTNLANDYKWSSKNYVIKYYAAIGDFRRITAKQWYTPTNTQRLRTFLQSNGIDENRVQDVIDHKYFNPLLEIEENSISTHFLKKELSQKFDGKTVVVTHHLPFRQPWMKMFKMKDDLFIREIINDEKTFLDAAKGNMHSSKDLLMMGFYTNNFKQHLDELHAPDLWVHGHLHKPMDDLIGKIKIVSSPVGYLKQSEEMTFKEIAPYDSKKNAIDFIRKEIELFPWNAEILENLRGFEKTILKYEEIIKTGLVSTETFQTIAQAFVHNHEHNKREIEKKSLYWLSLFYYYQFPQKINEPLTEDIREDIGFSSFMRQQVDKKSKKIFSLSMGVSHYSFLPEEKFNELNKTGLQIYHYKHWLKELHLAQLNINLYKRSLLEFCNYYERNIK